MKRGQEEIVGFVVIMVIVAIVFLIFLGISIRTDTGSVSENPQVRDFLESSMEYTTDCATRFAPDYSTIGELFEECHSGSRCLDGKDSCEALNLTLSSLFDSAWHIDNRTAIKGYEFNSIYRSSDSASEAIISLNRGVCTGSIRGNTYLIPAFPGDIQNTLEICY